MIRLLALSLALAIPAAPLRSQPAEAPDPVRPLTGSLLLTNAGPPTLCIRRSFLMLARGSAAPLVLLGANKAPSAAPWREVQATNLESFAPPSRGAVRKDAFVKALLEARGVWIEGLSKSAASDPLLRSLLRGVLERGGVVAGAGAGAGLLAEARLEGSGKVDAQGLGFLPDSLLCLKEVAGRGDAIRAALKKHPGLVAWRVPTQCALLFHHGRYVAAMGSGEPRVLVAAANGWPERSHALNAIDVVDPGDRPSMQLDHLSWRRSARDRLHPRVPEQPAVPKLARGTLLLHGGGGVEDATFERFVKAAGGPKARIVCIPSGGKIASGEELRSFSARKLRSRGCRNVSVLHVGTGERPRHRSLDLAPLADATGVWIDGGRTYRLMDCYEDTLVQRLLFDVLERDGIVAGSSAGCQVLGDGLVRGNPRTNDTLGYPGYTHGLGLLPGVILDAHFRQRKRQGPFSNHLRTRSHLLGIGVDEKTAIFVRGAVAEVIGKNRVSFYGLGEQPGPGELMLELAEGQRFDLAKRRRLK